VHTMYITGIRYDGRFDGCVVRSILLCDLIASRLAYQVIYYNVFLLLSYMHIGNGFYSYDKQCGACAKETSGRSDLQKLLCADALID